MPIKKDDCFRCISKRSIPGDAHIQCVNPDPKMMGDPHGVRCGWFFYPLNFDPVWKAKKCANFQERQE
jgi:hypothetical protein